VAARADGPRRARLEAEGVEVTCAGGDPAALASAFAGAAIVHVFRSGGREPLVPDAVRAAAVPLLVETNVFGQVDPTADAGLVACRLFVSKFCADRYRRRIGAEDASFHARNRVLHWPVELARLRELAPAPAQAKVRLGLDPARPVVGRVGRDDDRKWRDLLVDMVPRLLELEPRAQVLLVGATPAKLARLDRLGVLDRVLPVAPRADDAEVAALYAACDVFVTAAEIGESCSVAIAEAQALGLPVVTCSTPGVDDAQVEQVRPGETGHLASHPHAFAEAVVDMLGRAGDVADAVRADAERLYDAGAQTRQLERLYDALLASGAPPAEWSPSAAEVDAFPQEYARRRAAAFRPLTDRERAEVARAARLERARWALRAARGLDRERARLALSMAAARVRERYRL
jgi:glycosyltransferase involved in cell wall biosynthesis